MFIAPACASEMAVWRRNIEMIVIPWLTMLNCGGRASSTYVVPLGSASVRTRRDEKIKLENLPGSKVGDVDGS